ncbi:MAG: sugar phosphate isomerase/epimerase [Bacteroidales bacterium]|nr:sugar phosphate isomerase/epimerase [Bacteroidales bacterium]
MKKILVPTLLFVIFFCFSSFIEPSVINKTADEPVWKIGFQAYTFKMFSFEEALQKGKSINLKYVEAYSGQVIKKGSEEKTHFSITGENREKMKQLLRENDIKLVNYGVISGKNEEEWKAIFAFAKDMGIETITSEPLPEHLDLVEGLCEEYGINVAIHNHPKPSRYWDPDIVLKALEGRSKRMGVCADTGHWIRSGLNPVECLQKLEGKIISFHFKDLNIKALEAHDVPWGTGVADIPAILSELKRQNFSGYFMIEYEHNWLNSLPEIEECVKNFKKIAAEL